ncbi:diguanylate cyclase domain-containing protein [Metabacillus sp. Hm71]|uniref:sensor domain-containing diguanylate cyclase n=1 Tax=Metabacillus sp. Hm71 TaxID=3450743 RepID=UPI003F43EF92
MGDYDQIVVMSIKSAFFEYVSNNHQQYSVNEIIEKLTFVMKKELSVGQAVFLPIHDMLTYVSPYMKSNYGPIHFLPHDFIEGECYVNGEQVFIPVFHDNVLHGLIELNELEANHYSDKVLDEIAKACSSFYSHCFNSVQRTRNEHKFEQLYHLIDKLHSIMNKDDVLTELMTILQKKFYGYHFHLFLSQDHENLRNIPIKNLDFDHKTGNELAMEAYVTGNAQLIKKKKKNQTKLYTPLIGKQGVYGVLQVIANENLELGDHNESFIAMLANAAGKALENAQLYEQSKRLIKDLQLINETTHRLNKNLRLADTMNYMVQSIMNSFDADEVGFFYLAPNHSVHIFPGSTSFFHKDEAKVYIEYVQGKIEKDLEGLFIGDITNFLKNASFSSVMAVPMVQSENFKGCALVLHKTPYHFSFDMFKLLQSLIHHSTLALTNSLLREELETLVKTDHLTQLYSRKYFTSFIENSMKMDRQGTFVLIDIDNFKMINDTFGHQIGDDILVQVANIIKSNIRENDIGARWGGEELAIYLPQVDLHVGITVADRIVKRVKENTNPTITISCGVSYWNTVMKESFKQLFSRADKALYMAKNEGKNQVMVQV